MFGLRKLQTVFAYLAFCVGLWTTQTAAQTSYTPDQLVYQLGQHMLVRQAGSPPFHLKASFTASGNVEFKGDGTYEEWWVSKDQWRKEVTLGKYHLLLVSSAGKVSRSSSEDYVPLRVFQLMFSILPPLPTLEVMTTSQAVTAMPVSLQGIAMERLATGGAPPKDGKRIVPEHAIYVLPERNLVVMRAVGYDLWIYDKPGMLGDRSVMLAGELKRNKDISLKFNITELKANPAMEDGLWQPPADAVPGFEFGVAPASRWTKNPLQVLGSIDRQRLRQRGYGGDVLSQLMIDPKGSVREVDVVMETDPIIADYVTYDLHHFKYEPMMVDGKAQTISYLFNTREYEHRPRWNYNK